MVREKVRREGGGEVQVLLAFAQAYLYIPADLWGE